MIIDARLRRAPKYPANTFSLLLKCCNLTHTAVSELLEVRPSTITRYTYKGLPLKKKERLFEVLADPKKAPRHLRGALAPLMAIYNGRDQGPVFYLCPTNTAFVHSQSSDLVYCVTMTVKGRRSTDIIETLRLKIANIPANQTAIERLAVNVHKHTLDLS